MGHKKVCLKCYRVENLGVDLRDSQIGKCPECSNLMILINQRFRPPKKSDKKGWELVKFLISEGFPYQHIYKGGNSEYSKSESNNYIEYPNTLKEAKEFVLKYSEHKIEN